MSSFHPELWNPMWSVSSILTGLLSFMLEDTSTLGSITTSDSEKRRFASDSLEFNLKDSRFCELFPDLAQSVRAILAERTAASVGPAGGRPAGPGADAGKDGSDPLARTPASAAGQAPPSGVHAAPSSETGTPAYEPVAANAVLVVAGAVLAVLVYVVWQTGQTG